MAKGQDALGSGLLGGRAARIAVANLGSWRSIERTEKPDEGGSVARVEAGGVRDGLWRLMCLLPSQTTLHDPLEPVFLALKHFLLVSEYFLLTSASSAISAPLCRNSRFLGVIAA